MTNFEKMKKYTIEEMASEIKVIANWDKKEKKKAEQDEQFYIKYLNAQAQDDKCKVMNTEYCKTECPLCRLESKPA